MEEEFYSTIKLTSGEEIIAKVCYLRDEDSLLVEHPLLVEKLTQKNKNKRVSGFVLKEWINATYDEMFVIKMDQIITMTELDEKIEEFYLNVLDSQGETEPEIRPEKFSRRMGYLGSIKDMKKSLEDIYKRS